MDSSFLLQRLTGLLEESTIHEEYKSTALAMIQFLPKEKLESLLKKLEKEAKILQKINK